MAQMPTFDHKVKFFPIGEDPFMLGPQLEEYLNGMSQSGWQSSVLSECGNIIVISVQPRQSKVTVPQPGLALPQLRNRG